MSGGGFFVFGGFSLNPVKKVLWDYSWDTARCDDFPVTVFTDIFSVMQDSSHKIKVDGLSPDGCDTFIIKVVPNLLHGCALVVSGEDFEDYGGGMGVKLIVPVAVDNVTKSRGPAVILTF